jgi:hypothetical protein
MCRPTEDFSGRLGLHSPVGQQVNSPNDDFPQSSLVQRGFLNRATVPHSAERVFPFLGLVCCQAWVEDDFLNQCIWLNWQEELLGRRYRMILDVNQAGFSFVEERHALEQQRLGVPTTTLERL